MCPIDKSRARAFGPAPVLRPGASACMPGLAAGQPPRPPVHAGACPRTGVTSSGNCPVQVEVTKEVLMTRSDNQSYVTRASAPRSGAVSASLPLADLNDDGSDWGFTPAPGEYVDNSPLISLSGVYTLSLVKRSQEGGRLL